MYNWAFRLCVASNTYAILRMTWQYSITLLVFAILTCFLCRCHSTWLLHINFTNSKPLLFSKLKSWFFFRSITKEKVILEVGLFTVQRVTSNFGLFVTMIFVVVFLNHDHTFVNVTFQCCCNGWGERRFLRCKERGCCWHLQVLQWHPTFTCIFCMSSSNLLVFFHGVKFLSFGFFCIWVVILSDVELLSLCVLY